MAKSSSAGTADTTTAGVPRTFFEYLRSFGPGIVIVMTWMGAGDVVESAVSGGNYGYALMWVLALGLVVRFLFVSLIAKYHLCNHRGEGVLDGLGRLHPWYPPLPKRILSPACTSSQKYAMLRNWVSSVAISPSSSARFSSGDAYGFMFRCSPMATTITSSANDTLHPTLSFIGRISIASDSKISSNIPTF